MREDEAGRPREPGCDACRPEPVRPAAKSRTHPALRAARSKDGEGEDPLAGILLNAVLVAVGALLLLVVTPGETAPGQKGRLEAALSNIRKIRDSDPTFTRSAEVLALYDTAASVAGLKRPEVDRMRDEYSREVRRNVRD